MKIVQLQGIRSGVGTSFIAAALAYRFSMSNVKVLAVNANPSPFSLDQFFNLPLTLTESWFADVNVGINLFDHCYRYNDLLDVLPASEQVKPNNGDWELAFKALIHEAEFRYDFLVIDAGCLSSGAAKSLLSKASIVIDVLESEANSLMRLIRHRTQVNNEYYLFNKVWPLSRTQSDVSAFIQRYPQFVERLIPLSVPYDEYALQSSLYKQPITQAMLFSQSAEQINHLAMWVKQKLL